MSRYNPFKTKTSQFIETGSYLGDGIQLALNSGFETIYSIELCKDLHNKCKERFKDNNKVNLLQGDSSIILNQLLQKDPNISYTFWLDGHYSGPHTAKGLKECPLIEELEAILSRSEKVSDLIYVDDMRIYRDFDSSVNEANILKLVNKYKPHATISYEDTPYGINDVLLIEY